MIYDYYELFTKSLKLIGFDSNLVVVLKSAFTVGFKRSGPYIALLVLYKKDNLPTYILVGSKSFLYINDPR